jgi:hypothetical protein
MSSADATPDSTSATASMTSAQINRVVTNPATSRFTTTQVLPIPSANARARASVSSLVRWPRTSSHSAIIGTGEKKCVPTTRSGRRVTEAIAVIGIADVLVASTASSRVTRSSTRNTSCFASICSNTASMTISASPTSSSSVVGWIRSNAASASSRLSLSFDTNRSYDVLIALSPRSVAAVSRSRRITS